MYDSYSTSFDAIAKRPKSVFKRRSFEGIPSTASQPAHLSVYGFTGAESACSA